MLGTSALSEARPEGRAVKAWWPPTDHLKVELEAQQALFQVQAKSTQRWLETQARSLSEAIVQRSAQIEFTLPSKVVVETTPPYGLRLGSQRTELSVPTNAREHVVGGLLHQMARGEISRLVRRRLTELELSPDRATAVAAALLRHATATYMVYGMLPAGRSVRYTPPPGEEIPTIPLEETPGPGSALTAATDAIAEVSEPDASRGDMVVPYVPAARRFYLPQWVILDERGHLLVNSSSEAEGHLISMQRFLGVLHAAFGLAPYMLADDTYQQKRSSMLGQLINQGRAFARYETEDIIHEIQRRAADGSLNRGLRVSLPYFNDQTLGLEVLDFRIIPAARIPFLPQYVATVCREQQAVVAQDTRLSPSTCKYLLSQLKMIEQAFA